MLICTYLHSKRVPLVALVKILRISIYRGFVHRTLHAYIRMMNDKIVFFPCLGVVHNVFTYYICDSPYSCITFLSFHKVSCVRG